MFLGFPGGSDGKESACNVGDLASIPELGRSPGGGHCLENPHGQRSLAGYIQFMELQRVGRDRVTEQSTAHRHSYTGFGLDIRFQVFSEVAVWFCIPSSSS